MPTTTPNIGLYKPLVNDPTDQDLWGGYLNMNADTLDGYVPTVVPIGVPLPYFGASAPTRHLFCYGQAVSRTTYATLFAVFGTTFGPGDGSTTFNMPDLRGRALFGKDDMGGSAASRITAGVSGLDATVLGNPGGDQRLHQHTHAVNDSGHSHGIDGSLVTSGSNQNSLGGGADIVAATVHAAVTGISIANAGAGSSQNIPPAMICNWIMRY